ncbi:pseudouridine synthase Rsu [Bacteroides coprosuis DSM 18011]|uniref:Pseudouridine synthase n=1 Tax=Bacteroides coprosuis DSM 18011 TaxID=679937 RepID=F3ZU33_9BACE|nr:23S rRNA pseudouridine(2604) synthase RluF [Bacteroides coprosuis]EGJ71134.1 pseudouridine synthase Rsu [Bacteroides coprosuis DSM 18011]
MEYRLNKYISNSGYCSRREADKLIEAGQVKVNGKKASIGDRVYPKQKVTVNGELIVNDIEPVYIAFNKPVGIVSTTDPNEKANIVKYISHEQRIFPIGRLDKDSQGLILLTNDGDIVNKILRAGNNHKKVYIVQVDKPITDEFIEKMKTGVPILDRVTRKCEVEKINPYTFKIELIQGLNRQIRRMCAYFDYEVLKLERTQIMNIELEGLGLGSWRDLNPGELEVLFDMLEDSNKHVDDKGRSVSNKSINKQLELLDIQTDFRKSGLNAKNRAATKNRKRQSPAQASSGTSSFKPKKTGSGPRIGKQKASKVSHRGSRNKR